VAPRRRRAGGDYTGAVRAINVRWRPDVTAAQRAALEQRFHLAGGHQTEGTTWAYDLTDSSFRNIRAIVRDTAVDDTAHINRRLFRPEFAFDREARIACDAVMAEASCRFCCGCDRASRPRARRFGPQRTIIGILGIAPAVVITFSILVPLIALVGYRPLGRIAASRWSRRAWWRYRTVFRMLSAGADPNAAEPVTFEGRAEPGVLTPLEAAVESRQVELVQLLIKMGAHASDADRVRLACLARAVIAPEVEAYLQPSTPAASATDCGHIDLPPH